MRSSFPFILLLAACATSPRQDTNPVVSPAEQARRDGGIPAYTRADVAFMAGMIGHHAQAIVMARLAPKNGAGQSLQILAERIAVAQQDEIDFMSGWLRKRNEKVPAVATDVAPEHSFHGADHAMMPGMISPAQMDSLAKARDADFDRLFLAYMIQHHRGALTMLKTLFAAPGAANDGDVFRFASDVEADQTTEIDRMQLMLDELRKPNRAR